VLLSYWVMVSVVMLVMLSVVLNVVMLSIAPNVVMLSVPEKFYLKSYFLGLK
jgi:hypothetical protein